MSIALLEDDYQTNISRFQRLRAAVVAQVSDLLDSKNISLGVPIESRVKEWTSIEEKLQRKGLKIGGLSELQDLIGVRLILLFKRDLDLTLDLLKATFDVVSIEDTRDRLGDSMFGYQSQHLIVKLPKEWLRVPSFSALGDLHIEFQVRTLAQHIWAAVSHKLQYKNEQGVPPPIRRTINRASALLETVDLEFDRVLAERESYVISAATEDNENAALNVDSLAALLDAELPKENKSDNEPYAELLSDLSSLGVATVGQLRTLINSNRDAIEKKESASVKHHVERANKGKKKPSERIQAGVFYKHVGLARCALREEFGDSAVNKLFAARRAQSKKPKAG